VIEYFFFILNCSYSVFTGFEECTKNIVFLDKAHCCCKIPCEKWLMYMLYTILVVRLGWYSLLPIQYLSQYDRDDTIHIVIILAMVKTTRLKLWLWEFNKNAHSSDPLFFIKMDTFILQLYIVSIILFRYLFIMLSLSVRLKT
jgi:hypothetical protein